MVATVRSLPSTPSILWYLVSSFLYFDVIHTVQIQMATYSKFAVGMSDGEVQLFLLLCTAVAVLGGLLYGFLCQRVTIRTATLVALVNWAAVFVLSLVVRDHRLFLGVGFLAGIGLGGVKVTSRLALIALVPKERLTEFFGFFTLAGEAAFGPRPARLGRRPLALPGPEPFGLPGRALRPSCRPSRRHRSLPESPVPERSVRARYPRALMSTVTAPATVSVPLLDLKKQYASIREEVKRTADEIFESQYFILGPRVEAFEKAVAAYVGTKHAVGMSSGTDAQLAAMMALRIGPGDDVVTSPYTFFSSAGAIARLGARPVFCDIDPATFNVDPVKLARAITPKTKAIQPIHLYGQSADMDPILDVARKKGIPVIEDACQSLGAAYRGKKAGSMSEFGCFSFFPSKNLGAFGDGGMVTTNDDATAQTLRAMRMHGETSRYYHRFVGGNFRLDAFQAAILHVKLPHLDGWAEGRRRNAKEIEAPLPRFRRPAVREGGALLPARGVRLFPRLQPVRRPRREGAPRRAEGSPRRAADRQRHLLPGAAPPSGVLRVPRRQGRGLPGVREGRRRDARAPGLPRALGGAEALPRLHARRVLEELRSPGNSLHPGDGHLDLRPLLRVDVVDAGEDVGRREAGRVETALAQGPDDGRSSWISACSGIAKLETSTSASRTTSPGSRSKTLGSRSGDRRPVLDSFLGREDDRNAAADAEIARSPFVHDERVGALVHALSPFQFVDLEVEPEERSGGVLAGPVLPARRAARARARRRRSRREVSWCSSVLLRSFCLFGGGIEKAEVVLHFVERGRGDVSDEEAVLCAERRGGGKDLPDGRGGRRTLPPRRLHRRDGRFDDSGRPFGFGCRQARHDSFRGRGRAGRGDTLRRGAGGLAAKEDGASNRGQKCGRREKDPRPAP